MYHFYNSLPPFKLHPCPPWLPLKFINSLTILSPVYLLSVYPQSLLLFGQFSSLANSGNSEGSLKVWAEYKNTVQRIKNTLGNCTGSFLYTHIHSAQRGIDLNNVSSKDHLGSGVLTHDHNPILGGWKRKIMKSRPVCTHFLPTKDHLSSG